MLLSVSKIQQKPGLSQRYQISGPVDADDAAAYHDFAVNGEVEFSGTVTNMGNGTFSVEGSYGAEIAYSCSRCLAPCTMRVGGSVTALYGEASTEAADGDIDVRPLVGGEIDLTDLILSEIAFDFPMQPLCRDDCRGICPVCGTDLNKNACTCAEQSIDPRWEKLKDFKFFSDK
ncbi:MAG: DUF177 domain-containing protein [Firmicutes bacterium]|nr:DUF177 domain-containing protein [Bacillota bacterium]